jgi:acyl-CoA synthetase (AMP-forming)/AMP-acid ligase II
METIDGLVARDRRSEATALSIAGGATYDYHRFCTTAWKTGNFLRHQGVRDGVTVAVADEAVSQPLLSFFGVALLGGVTRFDGAASLRDADANDVQALVLPAADADGLTVPAGTNRVGYGAEPTDPAVAHFERDVWSENPSFPPVDRDPSAPVLTTDDATCSHGALLSAAERVADEYDLTADDRVAVRAPLSRPGTVVAGVVAPLLVGASILLPADEQAGTVAVATGSAPEDSVVAPSDAVP